MKRYFSLFLVAMAISCDPGQVIDFCELDVISCECTEDKYCIKVEQTDITEFQLTLSQTGADLVTDGDFPSAVNWTIINTVGVWSFDAVDLQMDAAACGAGDILEQTIAAIVAHRYYKLTFTIKNHVGGANSLLNVFVGGETDGIDYQANGTYTTYIFTDSPVTNSKLQFIGSPIAGKTFTGSIDDVSLYLMSYPDVLIKNQETGATEFDFTIDAVTYNYPTAVNLNDGTPTEAEINLFNDKAQIILNWGNLALAAGCKIICIEDVVSASEFESRCIWLQTNHTCTLEFSFTNSVNAFGLNYEDFTFTQYLRVDARLRTPRYQYTERIFEDDSGSNTLTYANKTKIYNLDTEPLPRDLHTALCLGMLHHDFQIDGVRFVREPGDYSPGWSKNYVLAPFQGEIKKASQPNQVNRLC